jgi:hypothetical protein
MTGPYMNSTTPLNSYIADPKCFSGKRCKRMLLFCFYYILLPSPSLLVLFFSLFSSVNFIYFPPFSFPFVFLSPALSFYFLYYETRGGLQCPGKGG